MITINDSLFCLHTDNTTYAFAVTELGHLEQLYYGTRININPKETTALRHKNVNPAGCAIAYDEAHPCYNMQELPLFMGTKGKCDCRTPFITCTFADGSDTCDFVYLNYEIVKGNVELTNLPEGHDAEESLIVTLKEKNHERFVKLIFTLFADSDVIMRGVKVMNDDQDIDITSLYSNQLDLEEGNYGMMSFHGNWIHEMNKTFNKVKAGRYVSESRTGNSSSHANPFVIVTKDVVTEDHGTCIGFNLLYSGTHQESLEVDALGRARFLNGMHPDYFEWHLGTNEVFEAPYSVMCYTDKGYQDLSVKYHSFIRNHIIPGQWKDKERPILINSWEACYMDFDENKLLKLAKTAKDCGIELFVLDDGWFGERNQDNCSLGDWQENLKKLPNGLKGLGDKINALGMQFGLWVEPEMISLNSDLYRAHPEYAVQFNEKDHSEGRHQRILDLSMPEVQQYIIDSISAILNKAPVSYIKWDMNRNFSDMYGKGFMHKYMLGLYHVLETLTTNFPDVLFEGCASGGNRTDLGILSYFPQIWASDNTDAISRVKIQDGYSYGYPLTCLGAHVSGVPNHQTLRVTPLNTRFAVAFAGLLGYELNLSDMKKEDLDEIKAQVALYKQWRSVITTGTYYRLNDGDTAQWMVVSADKRKAVGFSVCMHHEASHSYDLFRTKGLNEDATYHFFNIPSKINIMKFGDLINTLAPIHVKQDALLHQAIPMFIKMDGAVEDHEVNGGLLNHAGIKLSQGYNGTGYNTGTRLFSDYESRIYFMEQSEEGTNE